MPEQSNGIHFPRNNSLLGCGSSLHWHGLTVKVPLDKPARQSAIATGATEANAESVSDIEQGRDQLTTVQTATPPTAVLSTATDTIQQQAESQPETSLPTRTKTTVTVLSNVAGYVEPGQLLFIVCPSGCEPGNLLLDVLANQAQSNMRIYGYQYLDRQPKSTGALHSISKYIPQTDDLLEILTVKEALDVSAGLYLSGNRESRASAVLDVMDILGLTAYAHSKIGNSYERGLSKGHRRRVSIGCELVAAPQLLFLNEPTSGLENATAYNLMEDLRRISKATAIAMIITVHQPSQLILEIADNILLMSEGKTCYFGEAAAASKYFERLGFQKPRRVSDIEWSLDLINRNFGQHETVDRCIESWPDSNESMAVYQRLDERGVLHQRSPKSQKRRKTGDSGDSGEQSENATAKEQKQGQKKEQLVSYKASFLRQTKMLTMRGFLNMIRNPAVFWIRFVMYIMLSIIIGLVWFRLGRSSRDIIITNDALFYICSFITFFSISVLPSYLEERVILLRQRANNAFSIPAYMLSHTLYELPHIFILSISVSLITYFMIGFTLTAKRFLIFVANVSLTIMVAESIIFLIAAVTPCLLTGSAVGLMIFVLFTCVQGALTYVESVGWWIRWVKYVALHFYSHSAFVVNQHRGQIYEAAPDSEFSRYPDNVIGETIYRQMGLEERLWFNFVAQIAMVVFYRVLTTAWLHFFVKGRTSVK